MSLGAIVEMTSAGQQNDLYGPDAVAVVDESARIRHRSSRTRHVFRDSLDGIGAGGG